MLLALAFLPAQRGKSAMDSMISKIKKTSQTNYKTSSPTSRIHTSAVVSAAPDEGQRLPLACGLYENDKNKDYHELTTN